MNNRFGIAGVVILAGAGAVLIASAATGPQNRRPQMKRSKQQGIVVKQSDSALTVTTDKVAFDSAIKSVALPTVNVNNSMKARRDMAWAIVGRVWEPVKIPGGGKIPTWMTWYEQEDIQELYREMMTTAAK